MRRKHRLALGVAAAVLALTALSLYALPRTWHAESVLLAQRTRTLSALTNPGHAFGQMDDPTRAAVEVVLGHDNLRAIIDATDLLRRTERARAPLERLTERARALLGTRLVEEDRRAELEEQLRKRLYIVPRGETLIIGLEWQDPEAAVEIVRQAQQNFLQVRRAQEVLPIVEAIAILERRAAEARAIAAAALDTVERGERERARLGRLPLQKDDAPLRSPARPPVDRVERMLQQSQNALDRLLDARRRRLAELEGRLTELRTVYSERHPLVEAVRDSIRQLERASPEVVALRQEVRSLEHACAARSGCRPVTEQEDPANAILVEELDDDASDDGLTTSLGATRMLERHRSSDRGGRWSLAFRGDASERGRDDGSDGAKARAEAMAAAGVAVAMSRGARDRRDHRDEDIETVYARERLRAAFDDHERVTDRIEAARIELDVARAAFAYRYTVVRAPEKPRDPVRPRAPAVWLGGFICALVLGAFAATAVDRPDGASQSPRRRRWLVGSITTGLALSTLAALCLLEQPVLALAPAALVALVWATCVLPLRHSALTLLFLMLTLEGKGDASGRWQSPWATLGYPLNTNLNLVFPIEALRFTGADLVTVGLLLLFLWRRLTGSRLDRDDAVPAAQPLTLSVFVSLGALAFLIAFGLARGGVFAQVLWQCHQLGLIMVVVGLYLAALRGPQDLPALGKTILAAALLKAALAYYVRHSLGLDKDALPTATSHHDSMLFATAFCMLVALFFERRSRRNLYLCALFLPVLALGLIANNRRLAWIEIGAAVLVVYAMNPPSRFKRSLQRAALLAAPLFAIYVAAGWHGTSRIFGPVAKIRSIVDSSYDRSAQERDVENYNLIRNLADSPLIGKGFGHEYVEYVPNDDVSNVFPQWRFIPHNSILGLLAFGGLLGFTLLLLPLSTGVFLAARAYWRTHDPTRRAAALTSIAVVLIYLIQCYGDMGLISWHSVFLVSPALAAAAKLATASGAWPVRARRPVVAGPLHAEAPEIAPARGT